MRPDWVIGMSGGADSAVAALLLAEEGARLLGVTLKLWDAPEEPSRHWLERTCCKVGLARHVAEMLRFPHREIDARAAFRRSVVDPFINDYLAGRTPNPCVRCNEQIKFEMLLGVAEEVGARGVVTGHYAGIAPDPATGRLCLLRAADRAKDQTYFLHRLTQSQLARLRFPLSGMRKAEVWERLESLGLPAAEVGESQEVCFVTQRDYRGFLEEQAPEAVRPGRIVDREGCAVGAHRGIAFYTIGQRRGLGAGSGRRYVTGIDAERALVRVGGEEDLFCTVLIASEVNLVSVNRIAPEMEVTARTRYRGTELPARLEPLPGDRVRVRFGLPARAVSPGQSVVFYDGPAVVGGGVIEQTFGAGGSPSNPASV